MGIRKLSNLLSFFVLFIVILCSVGLLLKVCIFDPEEKKTQIISLINKYYDEKDYVAAKSFSEILFVEYYKDKEVTELFDKIVLKEKEIKKEEEKTLVQKSLENLND
jgi:hypothetical protein